MLFFRKIYKNILHFQDAAQRFFLMKNTIFLRKISREAAGKFFNDFLEIVFTKNVDSKNRFLMNFLKITLVGTINKLILFEA